MAARSPCACGAEREQVGIELVRRFRCPACGAEETRHETPPPVSAGSSVAGAGAEASAAKRRAAAAATGSAGVGAGGVALATPPPADPAATLPHPAPEPARPSSDAIATILQPGKAASAADTASVRFLPPPSFSDRSPELAAGVALGGFKILEVLGSGGMGIVYRARDEALARDVALKVISSSLCQNKLFVERFRREARAAAALNHPNITTIYMIGEERGTHFYSMELVRGQSLIERLESRGPFPPREAAGLMRQAAEGLRAAAALQIIHRDVKPSNLLVSEPGGTVKVSDFGLAKAFLGAVDQTTTGVVMGTPVYMSPEQGTGKPVDHRSDMYSLGVTFYQLVYGRPPFVADSAISLMVKHLQEEPEFPAEDPAPKPAPLLAIVKKMLEKDKDRRYSTYEALVADLTAFLEGRPVAAARAGPAGDDGVLVFKRARRAPGASDERTPATPGTMSRSRISIARASLRMSRADRALSLLRDVIREDPENRCEAAILLADVSEQANDPKAAREALEIVARESRDPAEISYASLKLAGYLEREAIDRDRAALRAYETALARSPAGAPATDAIAARTKALKARIEAAEKALARTRLVLLDPEG